MQESPSCLLLKYQKRNVAKSLLKTLQLSLTALQAFSCDVLFKTTLVALLHPFLYFQISVVFSKKIGLVRYDDIA